MTFGRSFEARAGGVGRVQGQYRAVQDSKNSKEMARTVWGFGQDKERKGEKQMEELWGLVSTIGKKILASGVEHSGPREKPEGSEFLTLAAFFLSQSALKLVSRALPQLP
jgi:hypothetical protein